MNPLTPTAPVVKNTDEAAMAPQPLIPVPRGPVPVAPPTPAPRMIEIKIDGQSVSVPEGATILDAARKLGIHTPTLCFLESLTPVNVCRVCVVELEGSRTLVPACSRKVEPNMSIKTDSERVRLSRRLAVHMELKAVIGGAGISDMLLCDHRAESLSDIHGQELEGFAGQIEVGDLLPALPPVPVIVARLTTNGGEIST